MGVVPVLLPLRLEPGHVHVRGTLRLAGLARQAEVHDVRQGRIAPRIGPAAGERLAEDVGPGPRRVLLVPGRHVAGAHRAPHEVRPAALADAGALLGGAEHALGGRKVEHRLRLGGGHAGQNPQRRVHRRRGHDLARIEDALRVEDLLHPLEEPIALGPDHRADELAAQPAVAVLAAEAAPVFLHQRGHVGGDVAKHPQAGLRPQVEQRPEVQFPRAGMGVVDAVDAVLLGQQPVELGDVGGQVLDGHRRVLDDLARLGVAGDVVDEPLPGPAQLPHLVAIGPEQHRPGVAEAGGAELVLDPGELCRHRLP